MPVCRGLAPAEVGLRPELGGIAGTAGYLECSSSEGECISLKLV
jgi:hypothetical protein